MNTGRVGVAFQPPAPRRTARWASLRCRVVDADGGREEEDLGRRDPELRAGAGATVAPNWDKAAGLLRGTRGSGQGTSRWRSPPPSNEWCVSSTSRPCCHPTRTNIVRTKWTRSRSADAVQRIRSCPPPRRHGMTTEARHAPLPPSVSSTSTTRPTTTSAERRLLAHRYRACALDRRRSADAVSRVGAGTAGARPAQHADLGWPLCEVRSAASTKPPGTVRSRAGRDVTPRTPGALRVREPALPPGPQLAGHGPELSPPFSRIGPRGREGACSPAPVPSSAGSCLTVSESGGRGGAHE